jgi:thiol-disulfide isomerase/thioredoxin
VSRWAGRALLAGLALLAALNLVQVVRNWSVVSNVTTPRGSTAPALVLPQLGGGTFRLADERGHPVVLSFWASWCGPCRAELPGVVRVAEALRRPPHTTRLVAVNTEGNPEAAAQAARELGLTMPVLLDDGSASQAYQVNMIPHTVLVDADGRVAQVIRGAASEAELMRAIERLEHESR